MNETEDIKELFPGDGEDPGEFDIESAGEKEESSDLPPRAPDPEGKPAEKSIREDEQKAAEENVRLNEQKAADERLLREAESFVREYPDVDVRDVPEEVWREVLSGRATLADAYARHENALLKREIAALRSRESARERTTGARRSSSGVSARDEFLSAFWE